MEYYLNHIIILIGIFVVTVSLIIIFIKKENNSTEGCPISSFSTYQEIMNFPKDLDTIKEENARIINEIKELKVEVVSLTNLVEEIHRSLKTDKEEEINPKENYESFSNLLNYNKFVNKNKDIINLLKQNKSSEEIAKILNKSIREVEMVIKLIK